MFYPSENVVVVFSSSIFFLFFVFVGSFVLPFWLAARPCVSASIPAVGTSTKVSEIGWIKEILCLYCVCFRRSQKFRYFWRIQWLFYFDVAVVSPPPPLQSQLFGLVWIADEDFHSIIRFLFVG